MKRKDSTETINLEKNLPGVRTDHPFRIRSQSTRVLVARALIASHMDYDRASDLLFKYKPADYRIEAAEYFEKDQELHAEVESQLSVMGLDDASKEAFVREQWRWLYGGDNDLKMTAARILGKAFMPEKADDRPVELKLKGIEDGLKQMMSGKVDEKLDTPKITEEDLN